MQYTKKGHKRYCPTAKYIDAAYQNCTNRNAYKEELYKKFKKKTAKRTINGFILKKRVHVDLGSIDES